MKTAPIVERNYNGWYTQCGRICGDGRPCLGRYYVHWKEGSTSLKRTVSADDPAPHVCREAE